jgi:hypothetical protein
VDDLLRVYFDPAEIGPDGYPYVWHLIEGARAFGVKDLIRERVANRCERCRHPYVKGQGLNDGWSACDDRCTHEGPRRTRYSGATEWRETEQFGSPPVFHDEIEARWRILTVHHLNGVKHDLRWWNLAALCQRCHLTIQAKVHMSREWVRPHTEWFRPHAAGFYAAEILGMDLSRGQVLERMDEILDTQLTQHPLEGFV